jgi:hypothetical protein
MNKILKSFLIIGLGLGIFTACDDDRDSNPTLISPTEFVLNTPAISGTVIDLANSSSIEISCSQPDYGFPAKVKESGYVTSGDEGVKHVMETTSYFLESERNILKLASEAGDEATVAMMSDYIKEQEKQLWMLTAYSSK